MKKTIILVSIVIFGLYSCNDDFLDRQPLDGINEAGFFNSSGDLESYMNGLYGTLTPGASNARWSVNEEPDNLVGGGPNNNINTKNISSEASQTNSTWNSMYTNIRSVNYLLANTYNVPRDDNSRQYTGEAFYGRALYYFTLLQNFGGVPISTELLNIDSEELYTTRASRDDVARQIIKDLDSAAVNLKVKANLPNARINRETALLLKTRVGLFEGSWEHYHGAKSTPYQVSGNDGSEFLNAAVSAGQELIDQLGNNVYNSGTEPYLNLFALQTLSNVPSAFNYRDYSVSLSVTHDWYGSSTSGWGTGVTKQLVDQYLMSDGLPAEISTIVNDETSLNALATNKDPRLGQSIAYPARGRFIDVFGDTNQHAYRSSYPGLVQQQQRTPSLTGYRVWKGNTFVANDRSDETPNLVMRYGEALLNFAEAKAILGSITQNDLDNSVNVLRSRAGMIDMNLGAVNGWAITYNAADGYAVGTSNVLNEIRRERRIELAFEGFRRNDLRRWALMGDAINGFIPKGAHAQEFVDYWNNVSGEIVTDGFVWNPLSAVFLDLGLDYDVDDESGEFFLPFFRDADFGKGGSGGSFDVGRDYLSSIPNNEILVYEVEGVVLEQNPGWN